MKKKILVFLMLVICLTLVACGNKSAQTESSKSFEISSDSIELSNFLLHSRVPENAPSSSDNPYGEPDGKKVIIESVEADKSENTSAEVSDNLFDYEFAVDGQLIKVPCNAADLASFGYSFDNKADNILETGYTTGANMYTASRNYISVGIRNVSGNEKKFSECDINDLYIREKNTDGQKIIFAKGITFGAAKEDVIAAFGDPSKIYEDGDFLRLTYYEKAGEIKNAVDFFIKNGALNEVDFFTA